MNKKNKSDTEKKSRSLFVVCVYYAFLLLSISATYFLDLDLHKGGDWLKNPTPWFFYILFLLYIAPFLTAIIASLKAESFWKNEDEELDDHITILDYQKLRKEKEWMKFYLYFTSSIKDSITKLEKDGIDPLEKEVAMEYLIHESDISDFDSFPKKKVFNQIIKKIEEKGSQDDFII